MKLAVCLLAAPVAGLVAPAAPKAETRLHSSDYAKTPVSYTHLTLPTILLV